MKQIRNSLILLSVISLLLISVPSALAYIFIHKDDKASNSVTLKYKEEIDETVTELSKDVIITADADSDYVFVRVTSFITADLKDKMIQNTEGTDWTYSDGYWYYKKPIKDGESTEALSVYYGGLPKNPEDGDNFHVVVVYESVPALFSETEKTGLSAWYDEENKGYWYGEWTDSYINVIGQGGE